MEETTKNEVVEAVAEVAEVASNKITLGKKGTLGIITLAVIGATATIYQGGKMLKKVCKKAGKKLYIAASTIKEETEPETEPDKE